jgi:hypothetical protein
LKDPADTDPDDWFELYNSGSQTIDLGGFWLTDNAFTPTKYRVPTNGQYRIAPGGFLLVWADDEANQNRADRADLHANFKLANTPSFIGLYAPDGVTLIDGINYGAQTNFDVSQGRYTDGAGTEYAMTRPTPRSFNGIPATNTPPHYSTIANVIAIPGQIIQVNVRAVDPDGQPLTFATNAASALPGSALIQSGVFRWVIPANQPIGDYPITITATDNGTPPLSDTTTFYILVRPRTAPVVTITPGPEIHSVASINGQATFTIDTIPGRTYRVFYTDDLSSPWAQFGPDFVAANATASLSDWYPAPARFYRVLQVD